MQAKFARSVACNCYLDVVGCAVYTAPTSRRVLVAQIRSLPIEVLAQLWRVANFTAAT